MSEREHVLNRERVRDTERQRDIDKYRMTEIQRDRHTERVKETARQRDKESVRKRASHHLISGQDLPSWNPFKRHVKQCSLLQQRVWIRGRSLRYRK
jgi:hypothetical protein